MIEIINPKQNLNRASKKEERIFPYYAGYSEQFAEKIISELDLPADSLILDPWNGSGTTCIASYKLGHRSIGNDLNPAMALVAKASFVSRIDVPSLVPLAHSITNSARTRHPLPADPLEQWFETTTSSRIRSIEAEINKNLVSEGKYRALTNKSATDEISALAAFFYLALFRATRRFVADFVGTNPTWIKTPKDPQLRKKLACSHIKSAFIEEVSYLAQGDFFFARCNADQVKIHLDDACNIGAEDESVDAIITSPPYCTRIDYAVATSIELALLRLPPESFKTLRRSLTGTSTVEPSVEPPQHEWGETCLNFLESVKNHTSRASKTYYYKSHVQYYRSIHIALRECVRTCKKGASLVFVVQNSYYKDIYNDVAVVIVEMGLAMGLELHRREDFVVNRSMSDRNVNSKKYEKTKRNQESVLIFKKK